MDNIDKKKLQELVESSEDALDNTEQIRELKQSELIKRDINRFLKFEGTHNLLNIQDAKSVNKKGILKEKTFMLTGKLSNMSRSEAKSLIEQNSGSVISNVSKKLDYLIVGENPTKRKIEAAKELKIKIINQNEWLNLLNKFS